MSSLLFASRLTQRVSLQKPVYSRDELGGVLTSWQEVASLWACIKPLQGKEKRLEVLLRYRKDVTVEHRLCLGSRVLKVISVVDKDEAGHTLEILAEEG